MKINIVVRNTITANVAFWKKSDVCVNVAYVKGIMLCNLLTGSELHSGKRSLIGNITSNYVM